MKRISLFAILLAAVLAISACGGAKDSAGGITDESAQPSSNGAADTGKQKKTIGLVMKTLTNPFFIEMEKGARRAETEFDLNLLVKTGAKETSIDQQIAIIEELTAQKVDAIVIAPGSSTELIPALKKAQDANIPIVNIDNRLDAEMSQKYGLANIPFISVDNEKGAYLAAKFIVDKINKSTEAVIIEGIKGTTNGEARKRGAEKAFGENSNIKVVASETANWNIDEAYEVVSKMYENNPDISAIFCANDMMALGVIQYLDKKSKKDVLVAGFDALEEARKAVTEGTLQVTIDQQAAEQGYQGVKAALDLIAGKQVSPELFIDVKVVSE